MIKIAFTNLEMSLIMAATSVFVVMLLILLDKYRGSEGFPKTIAMAIIIMMAAATAAFFAGNAVKATNEGVPAEFSRLVKGDYSIYEIGAPVSRECFWISSKDDSKRIFCNVPAKLRQKGTRFMFRRVAGDTYSIVIINKEVDYSK